jgi:truncated hemoglobin YjbI
VEVKHDIRSRDDIAALVSAFYLKATPDPLIGKFFTEVVQLSWEKHIPLIVDFWSTVLLAEGNYRGNVMEAHRRLHEKEPMKQEHFNRWFELWTQTVDELFAGSKADEAKQRGQSVAQFMHFKLSSS